MYGDEGDDLSKWKEALQRKVLFYFFIIIFWKIVIDYIYSAWAQVLYLIKHFLQKCFGLNICRKCFWSNFGWNGQSPICETTYSRYCSNIDWLFTWNRHLFQVKLLLFNLWPRYRIRFRRYLEDIWWECNGSILQRSVR